MKAYKIELIVVDHENMEEEQIIVALENTRYIHPNVIRCEGVDIGEWDDGHILNQRGTTYEQVQEIFSKDIDKL